MEPAYLGRGWAFPPTFDKATGTVEMVEGEEDIRQSLHILVTTALGERPMRADYGCDMEQLLFRSLDTRLATLMADTIKTAILFHETRIVPEDVRLDTTGGLEGVVMIEIVYRVRSTNSRTNLVFPYYTGEATDVRLIPTLAAPAAGS